jgi:hypothetical protein
LQAERADLFLRGLDKMGRLMDEMSDLKLRVSSFEGNSDPCASILQACIPDWIASSTGSICWNDARTRSRPSKESDLWAGQTCPV